MKSLNTHMSGLTLSRSKESAATDLIPLDTEEFRAHAKRKLGCMEEESGVQEVF